MTNDTTKWKTAFFVAVFAAMFFAGTAFGAKDNRERVPTHKSVYKNGFTVHTLSNGIICVVYERGGTVSSAKSGLSCNFANYDHTIPEI